MELPKTAEQEVATKTCSKCGVSKAPDQYRRSGIGRVCLFCQRVVELVRRTGCTAEDAVLHLRNKDAKKAAGLKHCKGCNSDKPRSEFQFFPNGDISVACKSCMPNYSRSLYEKKKSNWFGNRFYTVKMRAKANDLAFDLTEDYIRQLYESQEGLCALSGLPMQKTSGRWRDGTVGPYAATLDRKTPVKGYVRGNVRWVLHALNVALSNWGEAEFEKIAAAFTVHRR